MQPDWLPLLPFIIVALGGTIVFCLGAFWPGPRNGLLFALAILTCIASGSAAALPGPVPSPPVNLPVIDRFSRFYLVLFAAITAAVLLFSRRYTEERNFAGDEFPGVVLFASLGMMLVAAAQNWLFFFLGLELLSISLYILIAMRRGNAFAAEAAVKYFIMGAVASAFLVFGIGLVYAATGTLSLPQSLAPAASVGSPSILLPGLGFILVGIGFKVSLVPFHLWTPDVYQGAPSPVTAFLATGAKVALFAVLLRLALAAPGDIGSTFFLFLWFSAALTMIVGNVTALVQDSVKRLLAYSSIAHMGYLLMALLAVQHGGAVAVMFYSAVYAVSDLGAFGTLGLLSPSGEDRDRLDDFRGLAHRYPALTALLAFSLFSLAGLPATAGFIGKFVLFRAAFAGNLVVLGLIGIFTAILSMYFYLKVVVVLYMQPESTSDQPVSGQGWAAVTVCLLVTGAILWLGLLPSPLIDALTGLVAG